MTTHSTHSSNRAMMILAGWCMVVSSGNEGLRAADDDCSMPPVDSRYVERSRELVANGVPLDEVLGVLACLARNQCAIARREGIPAPPPLPTWGNRAADTNDDRRIPADAWETLSRVILGPRAARALFQLCDSDDCIRRYLIDIAADPDTNSYLEALVCSWLPFVANQQVIERLLSLSKDTWGKSSKFSAYANALQDIGSTEFLRWLDATIERGLEDGTLISQQVSQLRMRAEHIRIQQDPQRILDYLSSFDGSIDPVWAVHQAFRHGIDRNRIRSAVLAGLASGKDDRRKRVHFRYLLSQCQALGLLTRDEAKEFRVFPAYIIPGEERGESTHWADAKLNAKRRAFWHTTDLSAGLGP